MALLLVLGPTCVRGEVMPIEKVVQNITERRIRLDGVEAQYLFEPARNEPWVSEVSGDQGKTAVRETVFFRSPDRVRLNLSWPDREEVFLASKMDTLVMVGDQATDTPWPQPFLFYRLLVETDGDRLMTLLEAFRFDLSTVSLSPDGMNVIVGARPGDESRSQAWFDAKSFRLTRLILSYTGSETGYDLAPTDYVNHKPGVDWPHRIVVRMDLGAGYGLPVTLELRSLGINPKIDMEQFDLEELKRTVALPPLPGMSQDPDLVEVRKMMEWVENKLK